MTRKKNVQYANLLGGYCSSPPFPGSYRTRPLGTIDFTDPGGGLHNPPVYVVSIPCDERTLIVDYIPGSRVR